MEVDGQGSKRMKTEEKEQEEEKMERQRILDGAPEGMKMFMSWSFKQADATRTSWAEVDKRVDSIGLAVDSQGKQISAFEI